MHPHVMVAFVEELSKIATLAPPPKTKPIIRPFNVAATQAPKANVAATAVKVHQ